MKSVFFVALSIAGLLTGCGRHCNYTQTVPGPTRTVTVTTSTTIQSLVDQENQYRISIGQSYLTPGLSCSLSTVPANTPQIAGASLTYVAGWTYYGTFNVPNSAVESLFPVLPTALQPVYLSWYVLQCSGQVVVPSSAYYLFDFTSDDGGILTVDGTVINNDGNHPVITKSASVLLREGVHTFNLQFMQGPAGYQALIVNMNGSPVPSLNFYH